MAAPPIPSEPENPHLRERAAAAWVPMAFRVTGALPTTLSTSAASSNGATTSTASTASTITPSPVTPVAIANSVRPAGPAVIKAAKEAANQP
ncbi:hypothetical protein PG985_015081 [Apiospora marii]|uniref:uncharacterized protein n=1 Tax=Apiospora marii TaxID=335849 RepID=UPI00313154BE